ncbi:MAG TPA: DUF5654 family protein [Patescibacteria group bacterium]|nr:DUF5654 family protein [Patescibacteria group bacterium]
MIPTKEVLKELLSLSSAAFGLVAALAWNEAIQAFVKKYLSFSVESEMISKFLYALIVTILAVIVTVNLTKIKSHFDDKPKEDK